MAEVFLHEEMPLTEAELIKQIREATATLPDYKRISQVHIRKEEFEKTTSNKIKR